MRRMPSNFDPGIRLLLLLPAIGETIFFDGFVCSDEDEVDDAGVTVDGIDDDSETGTMMEVISVAAFTSTVSVLSTYSTYITFLLSNNNQQKMPRLIC